MASRFSFWTSMSQTCPGNELYRNSEEKESLPGLRWECSFFMEKLHTRPWGLEGGFEGGRGIMWPEDQDYDSVTALFLCVLLLWGVEMEQLGLGQKVIHIEYQPGPDLKSLEFLRFHPCQSLGALIRHWPVVIGNRDLVRPWIHSTNLFKCLLWSQSCVEC